MNRLPALALAFVAHLAFGQGPAKGDATVVGISLDPRKVHEECVRMEAGEKRKYHWKSTAPVDFNVHYHRGAEVFYPIKRDGMRGDGGTFNAKTAEEYCWMWTARDQAKATKIEGRIER
ncbi:MAG TPA: hypothetical protein VM051_00570 [Usitatibacter sp.]|nr:hypothetical protein [Usitatibacter sp.]